MKLYPRIIGLGLSVWAGLASATGDYDAIVSAVDFGAVKTGILAIAALLAVVLIAKKGAHMLLGFFGKA